MQGQGKGKLVYTTIEGDQRTDFQVTPTNTGKLAMHSGRRFYWKRRPSHIIGKHIYTRAHDHLLKYGAPVVETAREAQPLSSDAIQQFINALESLEWVQRCKAMLAAEQGPNTSDAQADDGILREAGDKAAETASDEALRNSLTAAARGEKADYAFELDAAQRKRERVRYSRPTQPKPVELTHSQRLTAEWRQLIQEHSHDRN